MNKGKFIVLYGINNLGKTTQAKLLTKKLQNEGHKAEYLKYPVYDLKPSGLILNNYLREGNTYQLTPREAQIFYALNRFQFEPTLKAKLEQGINIVSEDYVGTGLCWGIGSGVDEQFVRKINEELLKEDISFLFDGTRFTDSTESGHKHETNLKLLEEVRVAHLRLGEEFGWQKINANLPIEEIHSQIWDYIQKFI